MSAIADLTPDTFEQAVSGPGITVDEQPELAGAFRIRSIPTLAVLRDGKLVGIAPGVVGADDLVTALDKAAASE